MKLSELVKIRKRLLEFANSPDGKFPEGLDRLNRYVDTLSSFGMGTAKDDLLYSIAQVAQHIVNTDTRLANLIKAVDDKIKEATANFHSRGYIINGNIATNQTDVINEREFRISYPTAETKEEVIAQIRLYTNSRYPALEIGPGDGQWTEYLVAADPLYLIDIYEEFLNSTKSKFPEAYQRRLRTYLAYNNGVADVNLSMLPQNQFSFVFAWGVFDFFPLDMTDAYLKECFKVMRPGGVMLFSYNNGEDPVCAAYAETGFKSWMPKTLLIETAIANGFEVLNTVSKLEGVHWILIKKPGELQTVKMQQAVGEFLPWKP